MNLRLTQETAADYDFDDLCSEDFNIANGDLRFTSEQLDRMDMQLLRRLAAAVESDAVHGKSTKLEILSFFRVQSTLTEYGED